MDFLVFQYPMITVQACLDGILLGVLFALIAYGMALQWGVMNIINIAQGDFGISILFMQLMNFAFGADVVLANSGYGTTMLFDNNVVLPNSKIFSAFISIVFAICLVIYMKKSKLGRAIRATAQNARAAKILGVDTEKVYAATFGINAALCGVAGALISITFTIHPYMGLQYFYY